MKLGSVIDLSALDHYIKRELRCKHYCRYVDDLYIVGNSSQELLSLIPLIVQTFQGKGMCVWNSCLHYDRGKETSV